MLVLAAERSYLPHQTLGPCEAGAPPCAFLVALLRVAHVPTSPVLRQRQPQEAAVDQLILWNGTQQMRGGAQVWQRERGCLSLAPRVVRVRCSCQRCVAHVASREPPYVAVCAAAAACAAAGFVEEAEERMRWESRLDAGGPVLGQGDHQVGAVRNAEWSGLASSQKRLLGVQVRFVLPGIVGLPSVAVAAA